MLHRYLTIVPVPPSYRDPRDPLPTTAHHVRPAALDPLVTKDNLFESDEPRSRPTVYFTLGTIFPQESGDLFSRVIAGVSRSPRRRRGHRRSRDRPCRAGRPAPQRASRAFPPSRRGARGSDLVLSHGGSGTVIGALGFGLPQVLIPIGADQPLNGDRCEALGVAIVLDATRCTADTIGRATAVVLSDPSYRARRRGSETRS